MKDIIHYWTLLSISCNDATEGNWTVNKEDVTCEDCLKLINQTILNA